jgi:PAS domain S-box-containing protein
MIIAITVFFSETCEMIFFSFLSSLPYILEALVDATLLVILISPVLYFFVYRPFVQQINNLDRTERALQKANLELEKRVDQRTAALTAANEKLRQEIADRKRAERVLKESVERIRRIADNLPLLVAYVDADQRYQFANHEFENWFGISPSEFVGQEVKAMLGPGAYKVVRKRIETVLSGQSVSYEDKLPLPDGSFRHYHANYIPDLNSGNVVVGFYMVAQDISDRKLAEKELKREMELNAGLSELYEPLISPSAKIEDIAFSVLDKAKRLTHSEHGYVSSIDPVTGDNVSHTLTEMLLGQCKVNADQKIVFPIGENGRYISLWGHALNSLEPFFTNIPTEHPASTGLPQGHIPQCWVKNWSAKLRWPTKMRIIPGAILKRSVVWLISTPWLSRETGRKRRCKRPRMN